MSLLDRIWNTSLDLWYLYPRVELKIDGFDFSVTRKQGALLTSSSADNSKETKPGSADFYYEASVRPNGKNPEYPEREKPSLFYFTYGLDGDTSRGMIGRVGYIPNNFRFLKFELQEEFCRSGQNMGALLPDHHSVYIQARFRDERGHISKMGFSAWNRQSEQALIDSYRGAPIMSF